MIHSNQRKLRHLVKFKRPAQGDFLSTLKARVATHFENEGSHPYANSQMIMKSIFMLALFFVPLGLLSMGWASTHWQLFALYICAGFGMAGIGMGVMHDAIHGSYSRNKVVNRLLGYTFNLIGANDVVWRMQHNVLHHSFTNIDHSDDDLNAPFFLRFSPDKKHYKVHRYQHLYVWFFYGLSTLSWITTKDFVRLNRYYKMGIYKGKSGIKIEFLKVAMWKLVYYSYALILPLIFLPFPFYTVLLAFVCMHFVTGLSVSLVFQTAHVMPSTAFPQPNESGELSNKWAHHQLLTTTNFSPHNRLFSWLIGGLNFQVEHHLLPHICHIHYRKLAPIVAATAQEFGLPYLQKDSFAGALSDHANMLYALGRS